jgi:hypothetical protein
VGCVGVDGWMDGLELRVGGERGQGMCAAKETMATDNDSDSEKFDSLGL